MLRRIEPTTGLCRMCHTTAALEAGHVVPAFVFRWLKQTAVMPYLWNSENPNLRLQDGWTRPWFCRSCEDCIGRYERAFSEQLFPLVAKEASAPFPHGPWLSRFIASVAWRTVTLYSERSESFEFFTPEQKGLLPQAMDNWRAFVHDEADTPGIHELHFLPMAVIADFQGDRALPPNINRYTLRTIDVHVASSTSMAFAFVKMGPAVALGFIQPPPPNFWVGTRVSLSNGQVGGKMRVPLAFLDYFIERARQAHASQQARSARQRDKIERGLLADPERTVASETFRAVAADVERFGVEQAFASEDDPNAGPDDERGRADR